MEFIPENELETALVAAADNPEARPRFYEVLAQSNLYVIDESDRPLGHQVAPPGGKIAIRPMAFEGVAHIPAFSSSRRIGAIVSEEVRFMAMKATDLFELTQNSPVILNPGSQYGKQLLTEEIAGIRDGSIFARRERIVLDAPTEVMLGQPADYPKHVTDALSAFFKTKKAVRAAYLAHAFFPKSGQPPHTMIGVDVEVSADYDRLADEIGLVLEGVIKKDELVDVIRIGADAKTVSDYMTQTAPFFRKRWLGIF